MQKFDPEERCPKCGGEWHVHHEKDGWASAIAWIGVGSDDDLRRDRVGDKEHLALRCQRCGHQTERAPLDAKGDA